MDISIDASHELAPDIKPLIVLPTVSLEVIVDFGTAKAKDPPPKVDIPSGDAKVEDVPPLVVPPNNCIFSNLQQNNPDPRCSFPNLQSHSSSYIIKHPQQALLVQNE